MRIGLVVHGFPPLERTGVENHTAALARALVRAGHRVEVFTPRAHERLPQLSLRREQREGFGVTWVTTNRPPKDPSEALDPPGIAERFAEFLDQERPEVVHFQHVIKVGLGLVEAARERGIPTLFTAHDYYGICHRYTLTRPDLSPCDTVGDPEACARCDLALSILNRQPALGDYHMGALADQLDDESREALRRTLVGELADAGFTPEESEEAIERRVKLDERRAEVFALFDRVLSPSRYLADRLIDAGLDGERVGVMPLGIETHRLAGVQPPRPDRTAPLRFGFVGSLTKHKGVHVLLEAFGKLDRPAECIVWGGSTDHVYVERMRALAAENGVQLAGSFEQDELAECLSRVDVLIVPSIWVENHPLTIREAFAGGRPVIASRLGALPENVHDGVDGLLFEPGDAEDLASAMRRLIDEEGLYDALVAQLPPTREIADQVAELVPIYAEMASAAKLEQNEELADLPAHMRAIAARERELSALPTRDLFLSTLAGLARLREGLGTSDVTPEEFAARALSQQSKAKLTLRDLERRGDWLEKSVEETESVWAKRVQWREDELASAKEESGWLRTQIEGLTEERDWLLQVKQELETERDWLREESEGLRAEVLRHAATVQAVEGEIRRLTGQIEDERGELRERVQATAEVALAALKAQESVLGREMSEVIRVIDAYFAERAGGEPGSVEETGPQMAEIVPATRRAGDALQEIISELDWRRREMQAAAEMARRRVVKTLVSRTGLGKRVEAWGADGAGTSNGEGMRQ